MRKINVVIAAVLMLSVYSYGAFNIINSSARTLGMGNAYVGVADDINSLLGNPSGLSNAKSIEATFTGTKLHWGVAEDMGENFAAVVVPMKGIGALGAGYYSFSHPLYSESVMYFGYSLPVPLFKKSAIGLSGKYLSKSYTANEWTIANPDFTALTKNGISVGVSLYSQINTDLSVGVFVDDLNAPDVGAISVEELAMTIRAGAKYILDKSSFVTLEGYSRGRDFRVYFGGENDSLKTGDFGVLLIRIGGGIGNNSYMNATAGIGYRFNIPGLNIGGQVDYGFQFPFNFASGSSGTHMAGITFRESSKDLGKGSIKEIGDGVKEERRVVEKFALKKDAATAEPAKAASTIKSVKSKYDIKFTEIIESAIVKTGKFNVTGREKAEKLLEGKKELSGCVSAECAVETGRLLGVKNVVTGSISLSGKIYLVNVRILDADSGKILMADMERCRKDEDVAAALQKLADRIAGSSTFSKAVQTIAVMDFEER